MGFTLAQKQSDREVVIAYNGRGLSQAENIYYSPTKREALTLVEGIKNLSLNCLVANLR